MRCKARRKSLHTPATPQRIELSGGLEKTVCWMEIKDNGSLIAELYDFSTDAQNWFGNDVAFLLTVHRSDKDRLLLALLQERFDSYYAFKEWLAARQIPFETAFDSWA
jgi:hypothetical protein